MIIGLGRLSGWVLLWGLPLVAVAVLPAVAGAAEGATSYADSDGPVILAHRGGAHEYEENTMAAFKACYERGIRAFETDIRMTKDGVLVILHDDSFDRTHHATGPVEEKTADEIREITSKQGQKMLFLEELLQYLADKPGMYVELEMKTSNKTLYPDSRIDQYCQQLHALAKQYEPEGSYYLFTSFDERPLRAIRQLDAQAPTAYIAGKPLTDDFIEKCLELGAQHLACRLSGTTREAVQKAQKAGLKVNCWPGHTVADYLLGVGLGVDVSCTDIPVAVIGFKEQMPSL